MSKFPNALFVAAFLCTGFALYGPARYVWAQVTEREKAEEEPLF